MDLKSSRNKKGLNDVTAALFLVVFLSYQLQKNTKNGAAVTSLRPFLFRNDFSGNYADIVGGWVSKISKYC